MKNISLILALVLCSTSVFASKNDCKKTCQYDEIQEKDVFLGVQIDNTGMGKYCKVIDVFENTAAEYYGLKLGDIIMSVNDVEIKSHNHIVTVIQSHKPREVVQVTYMREGVTFEKDIRLGAKTIVIVKRERCCDEERDLGNNVISDKQLTLYPNPANEEVHIELDQELDGEVEVICYSAEGKELNYVIFQNKGRLNYTFITSQLPVGNYILRVTNNGQNYISKLEVAR